ncbi:MAG: transposase [Cyanobacteria bacterium J06635_10]
MQTISVKCKLQVPVELRQEIDVTLQGFADACNQIYEVAKRENCWNTTKLHHKVYKPVREGTGLKANHVCQAIRRAIGNAKAVKQVHKFRPTSLNLDVRTFQYIEDLQTVGITLMCGRKKFKLSIGNYQKALLKGQSPTAATLNKTKRGDYYINICVDLPTNPTGKTPKVIGVDLGRRDIATTSTGKSWNGEKIQATRDRYSKVRANIQSKRTRSCRRLMRRLSGREQRFQKWLNHPCGYARSAHFVNASRFKSGNPPNALAHNISKQLVQDAKNSNAALAFEDLTNIRQSLNQKRRSRTERRRTNNWAFYQLRMFVDYKARIAGIPVVFVPPAYTSQTCKRKAHAARTRCHHVHPIKGRSYRNGKKYKCGNCGFEHDADINEPLRWAALPT